MPDSAGSRLVSGAHQWARFALALLVLGPSVLVVYAWVEVLNHPGYSLVDGYWIGRTPWAPIGVVVTLAGGVAGLISGSVAIAFQGGWWRRALLLPAWAAAALWWATALGLLPVARFRGPDPVTLAYSLPSSAALFVLMPAAMLAALALTPNMPTTSQTPVRRVPIPHPQPRAALDEDAELELPPAARDEAGR